jgi:hypothetical protein
MAIAAPLIARGVHLFADVSNLIGGAHALAVERHEFGVRLDARRLRDVLADGRPVASANAVLNARLGELAIRHFESAGWVLDVVEPGLMSGREQFADQALQARLFEALRRYPRLGVVLATGDGAGNLGGRGFLPYLDIATRVGGTVEVASWSIGLNRTMAAWAASNGRLRILDPMYDTVTFVEGGRPSLPPHTPLWEA